MKILVVEDEPKIIELIKLYLESRGHEVVTSSTGQGAIEVLAHLKPDAILLDLWLKDKVDGIAVLKEAKRVLPQTAVIISTGLEEESTLTEVMTLGAHAVLKKPIQLDELDQLLTTVPGQRSSAA